MNLSHHIRIQFKHQADSDFNLRTLKKLVHDICTEFNVTEVNIQINIVDDAGIAEIHRQFLKKTGTTDVISFDLSDEFEPGRNFLIAVNADMARRQAEKRGHSPEAELALYIVHGLLHQLGYDDLNPRQAKRMHEKEDTILQSRGFGVIYRERKTKG
jgi:probable rRNA maturation factor